MQGLYNLGVLCTLFQIAETIPWGKHHYNYAFLLLHMATWRRNAHSMYAFPLQTYLLFQLASHSCPHIRGVRCMFQWLFHATS
jgi:hypothetical protein